MELWGRYKDDGNSGVVLGKPNNCPQVRGVVKRVVYGYRGVHAGGTSFRNDIKYCS